jgi:predicted DNA-binding transcriptional regulator AlpA
MNIGEVNLKPSPVKRTKDAWKYLSISRSAFLKLVALGHIPRGIKLTPNGRAICWRTADLDAYLKSRGV